MHEASALVRGVLVHIVRAATLRSDGAGLPAKPGAVFAPLLAVATAAAVFRHSVAGVMPPAGAAFGFLILVMVLAGAFGTKRFACVSLYLCLSAGIDSTAAAAQMAGVEISGTFLFLWEAFGLAYGCHRFERRRATAPG